MLICRCMRRQTNSRTGAFGVRAVYLACSTVFTYFLALVRTFACGRSIPEMRPPDALRTAFGAAISTPCMTSRSFAGEKSPPDNPASSVRTSVRKMFANPGSPRPQARMNRDHGFQFHRTSPVKAGRLLADREDEGRIHIETPGERCPQDTNRMPARERGRKAA